MKEQLTNVIATIGKSIEQAEKQLNSLNKAASQERRKMSSEEKKISFEMRQAKTYLLLARQRAEMAIFTYNKTKER